MNFIKSKLKKFNELDKKSKIRSVTLNFVRFISLGVIAFGIYELIYYFMHKASLEAKDETVTYSRYVFQILQATILFGLTFLPRIIEKIWKITIPLYTIILFIAFCVCAIFFGEIFDFYAKFEWWDDALHTFSGFYIAAIGFFVISILNEKRDGPMKLSPGFVQLFAFVLAMASEAVWEIFEYSMDGLFGSNMQRAYDSIPFENNGAVNDINDPMFNAWVGRNALKDTMGDMIEVLVGAFIMCMIGYVLLKRYDVIKQKLKNLKGNNSSENNELISDTTNNDNLEENSREYNSEKASDGE